HTGFSRDWSSVVCSSDLAGTTGKHFQRVAQVQVMGQPQVEGVHFPGIAQGAAQVEDVIIIALVSTARGGQPQAAIGPAPAVGQAHIAHTIVAATDAHRGADHVFRVAADDVDDAGKGVGTVGGGVGAAGDFDALD